MNGTLSQVGFAEFVGKLLSEVFDAVVTSQLDQRRQIDDLADSARLTEEEVASRFIDVARVEAEVDSLFPGGVHAGALYHPGSLRESEAPPFAALLGLTLKPDTDFAVQGAKAALTEAGAERIRNAVRLRLAASHLAALRALVARGAPLLFIESGRVAAKLTYQLASGEPAAAAAPTPAFSPAPALLRRKFEVPRADASLALAAPSPFRLAVRQASDRTPQLSQLQVDVYGEVEVRFKTLFS
jgi:hypothetical protein